ncbi:hypothetical protein [Streptomyces sp. NPDC056660]|uniref:hypothetical protein n=1 Tax=Streptomyces sp. NPDC056660 TaxID=3345897 RepID=UPI00367719E0
MTGKERAGDGYCTPHADQCRHLRQEGVLEDEDLWRLTTPAIAESRKVSLRGLPGRVVAEFLYGLQERIARGLLHKDYLLRNLSNNARAQQVTSLDELDLDVLTRTDRTQARGFLKYIRRFGLSPETERHKDVWDASVFGLGGTFSFTGITQLWLREGAKAWALDDIPRRRGKSGKTTVQRTLKSLSRFSESLYLSRDDHGVDLPVLGRIDITAFLGRLSILNERGDISACTQYMTVRHTRRVLTRLRTLGLTTPGQPLHGLTDDFALRQEDIPHDPEDSEAGRDLPLEVMRQLCAHLDSLETVSSADVRTAIELIIDTGRRPNEICKLTAMAVPRPGEQRRSRPGLRQHQEPSQRSPATDPRRDRRAHHQAATTRPRPLPRHPGRQAQTLPRHPGQPPWHEGESGHHGAALRQEQDLPLLLPVHLRTTARRRRRPPGRSPIVDGSPRGQHHSAALSLPNETVATPSSNRPKSAGPSLGAQRELGLTT